MGRRCWVGIGLCVGLLACEDTLIYEEAARRDEAIAGLEQQVSTLQHSNIALQQLLQTYESRIIALEATTEGLERPDGDFVFTGGNVQILNGQGDTSTTNGKGNLIIGYNEERSAGGHVRTGSHNLVLGRGNDYSSYYGIVNGAANKIFSKGAVILSGLGNSVTGPYSVVVSGAWNENSAEEAVIVTGSSEELGGTLRHQMIPVVE